jgi:hypothetical protein
VLVFALVVPFQSFAQKHVVSSADLQKELKTAAGERDRNIATLEKFFDSDTAQRALSAAKLDPAKVRKSIPLLDDAELARLAAQADRAEVDFAASGISLTNQQVTYIIIGVIAIAIIAIIASR